MLAPFRRGGSQARSSYVATLSHHMMYHLGVGFAGALVYTPPSLVQGLLGDGRVAAWVQEGRLLLLLWDRFSTYQEVDTNINQVPVPIKAKHISTAGWMFDNHTSGVNRLMPPSPLPLQTYYEVPDQVLVNNHALLAFSGQEGNIALFFADIDEFFVPQVTVCDGGRVTVSRASAGQASQHLPFQPLHVTAQRCCTDERLP